MDKVDVLVTERTLHIAQLYRDIETQTIYDIARMIRKHGYITATSQYQLDRLMELNGLDKEVIDTLSRMTGLPKLEIMQSLSDIGLASIDYDLFNKAFKQGLITKSIKDIDTSVKIRDMQSEVSKVLDQYQSTAITKSFQAYKRAIDIANIKVSQGLITPDKALVESVVQLAKEGITTVTYLNKNGNEINYSIESAMTRNIRTNFIQVSNETSHDVGLQLETEHWYVTQHLGARDKGIGHENHESWQNGVYTEDELYSVCGWKEVTGLGGVNCRHRMYAYFKGISVPPPSKINTVDNNYVYALNQRQRALERAIRESKRTIGVLEQLGDIEDVNNEIIKQKKLLNRRQANMRAFIKKNEEHVKRDYTRERVLIT